MTDRVVVAMSYDPVHVLSRFAEEHDIRYPLLSDEGSRVIRELGLENTQFKQQNDHFGLKTDERHVGMPYPGSFLLDEGGFVRDTWFEQSHRVRPSGAVLLADVLEDTPSAVQARSAIAGIAIEAGLHTDTYHPQQIYRLRLRLGIPRGQHVYVGNVPDGFTSLAVQLSGADSLVADHPDIPRGSAFETVGIAGSFEVIEGVVEMGVDFRIDEDEGDVPLTATVSLQTCTDRECFPPADVRLVLPLKAGGVLRRS